MLPLTFANPADYDLVDADDKVSILGLTDFQPGKPLTVQLTKKDGKKVDIVANHTFNDLQISWFKAGSALNKMKERTA